GGRGIPSRVDRARHQRGVRDHVVAASWRRDGAVDVRRVALLRSFSGGRVHLGGGVSPRSANEPAWPIERDPGGGTYCGGWPHEGDKPCLRAGLRHGRAGGSVGGEVEPDENRGGACGRNRRGNGASSRLERVPLRRSYKLWIRLVGDDRSASPAGISFERH